MSHEAIACLEIKPTGEPVVESVTNLDPKWNAKETDVSLTMSFAPDGKWVYASYWNWNRGGPGAWVRIATSGSTNAIRPPAR